MRQIRWRQLVVTMLIIASGVCSALSGEVPIATVDMARVVREYHKTKLADAELARMKTDLTAELERMRAELATLEAAFEAAREETRNEALNEAALKEKYVAAEKQLMAVKEYEQRIKEYVEKAGNDLVLQAERMGNRFLEEIGEVVAQYSEDKRIGVVFDSSTGGRDARSVVIYSKDSVNITDEVIEILNKQDSQAQATDGD